MDLDDLESIPWNIILLFAGAMSIGNCLWQTGAANWMAVNWLAMFQEANWFVFVMSIAFFVMIMTNVIMNVAAIAISSTGGAGHCALSGCCRRGHSVCSLGDGRHALSVVGGCGPQCHCLRLEAVYNR